MCIRPLRLGVHDWDAGQTLRLQIHWDLVCTIEPPDKQTTRSCASWNCFIFWISNMIHIPLMLLTDHKQHWKITENQIHHYKFKFSVFFHVLISELQLRIQTALYIALDIHFNLLCNLTIFWLCNRIDIHINQPL